MSQRDLIEEIFKENMSSEPEVRFSKVDWLDFAINVLKEHGIDEVKITQLAKSTGVTRGGFYWHFKNRSELLDSIIEVWKRKNTASIIHAASYGSSLEHSVLAVFEIWLDFNAFDPKLDFSIRDWARRDKKVNDLIISADRRRLTALSEMFNRYGFGSNQSEVMARNLYYMQMGYYAINVYEPMSARLDLLPIYLESYTGQKLKKESEAKFRKLIISRRELWGDEIPPDS
jgi:AcrR family transcriptional regulator